MHNLLAGFAQSLWLALLGLAVAPLYLKYLGLESFGIIGWFISLQAMLAVLDLGLAPTLTREVARCKGAGQINDSAGLLHSLVWVYWLMAALIALLFFALAPLIAEHWLHSPAASMANLNNSITLMGLALAARWPVGLYQAALLGAQRQALTSAINSALLTLGSAGVIPLLAHSPTLASFFVWQIGANLAHTLILRGAAWQAIGKHHTHGFDWREIKRVSKFSADMTLFSMLGMALMQSDKLILSNTVSLAEYGQYILAGRIAACLYLMTTPIFNFSFAPFCALIAQQRTAELLARYSKTTRLLAALLCPLAMVLIVLLHPLIALWTGDGALAVQVAPFATLLLLALTANGVLFMPYTLLLAYGDARLLLKIHWLLLLFNVPLTVALSLRYGGIGGAAAQLALFVLYLLIGPALTHKKYLKGYMWRWFIRDCCWPALVSLSIGFIAVSAIDFTALSSPLQLFCGLAMWLAATAMSFLSLRKDLVRWFGQIKSMRR